MRLPRRAELDEILQPLVELLEREIPEFNLDTFEMDWDKNWDILEFLWRGDNFTTARGPGIPQRAECPRCGWWLNALWWPNLTADHTAAAALRQFDISDQELTVSEIQSHLAKNFSDIYSLPSRRFEEVVAAIYSGLGWDVTLTAQTRDGGTDLICLQTTDGRTCLVECKRYKKLRKIGIEVVDRLVGVSFRVGAKEAHIVTTTTFSIPAKGAASEATGKGLAFSLVDVHELNRLIDVYANPSLTVKELRAIFPDT